MSPVSLAGYYFNHGHQGDIGPCSTNLVLFGTLPVDWFVKLRSPTQLYANGRGCCSQPRRAHQEPNKLPAWSHFLCQVTLMEQTLIWDSVFSSLQQADQSLIKKAVHDYKELIQNSSFDVRQLGLLQFSVLPKERNETRKLISLFLSIINARSTLLGADGRVIASWLHTAICYYLNFMKITCFLHCQCFSQCWYKIEKELSINWMKLSIKKKKTLLTLLLTFD